jgi:hypothetical protein
MTFTKPSASTLIILGLTSAVVGAGSRSYMRSHLPRATNTDTGVLTQIGTKLGVKKPALTKDQVAQSLAAPVSVGAFPTEISFNDTDGQSNKAVVEYSFDAKLQDSIEQIYKQWKPDYGAFVAMDAKTGRVLSMVSYSKVSTVRHLFLRL